MIEEILRFIMFSIPEAIILSLSVIYLLNIRCKKSERVIAVLFTSIVSSVCYNITFMYGLNILFSIVLLSIIYKGWYDYTTNLLKYFYTTTFVLIMMFMSEVFILLPIVYLFNTTIIELQSNIFMLFIFTIPLRFAQFTITHLLYRRYINYVR